MKSGSGSCYPQFIGAIPKFSIALSKRFPNTSSLCYTVPKAPIHGYKEHTFIMNTATLFDYPTLSQPATQEATAFLSGWSHTKWTKFFRYCQTLRFSDGNVLIAQGSTERAFYLIAQGQFEVLSPNRVGKQPHRLAVMEAGAIAGEQTFLDNQPAHAEVRAIGEAEAVRFSHDAFAILANREQEMAHDILFDLGRLGSLRLRALMPYG